MKIGFIINKKDYTARIKYFINYFTYTTGIQLEPVYFEDKSELNKPVLSYLPESQLLKIKKTSVLNIFYSGLTESPEKAEENIIKYKFNNQIIPVLGSVFKAKNDWKKSASDLYMNRDANIWQTETDYILNIFYHLSRFEERMRLKPDDTQATAQTSVLYRFNAIFNAPVDLFVNQLKKQLENLYKKNDLLFLSVESWPNAQNWAAAFTHDVDIVRGVGLKNQVINRGKKFYFNLTGQKEKAQQLTVADEEIDQKAWSFPELLKIYRQKKIQATFFFIARPTEGFKYRYDIAEDKFVRLFEDIIENGHEIGLHPSYKSFENPDNYISERDKLELILKNPVSGARQHYLRAKYPRLWYLLHTADFKYDSSLGYNYQVGFRAGTSKPFPVFDYQNNKQLELFECPLAFMEYTLTEQCKDQSEIFQTIDTLIKHVRKNNGLIVSLLHPHNFQQPQYNEIWMHWLKKVARNNVYKNSLSGIYKWLEKRNKIKVKYDRKDEGWYEIRISKPADAEKFSLYISRSGKFKDHKNARVKSVRKNIFRIRSNKSRINLKFIPE